MPSIESFEAALLQRFKSANNNIVVKKREPSLLKKQSKHLMIKNRRE